MKTAVVGCGGSGLSCGIKLLEAGLANVTIIAEKIPPYTTSNIAAAIWMPYKVMPEKLAIQWAQKSLEKFTELWEEKLTYVIPRTHDCIVRGTAEENNWDEQPDLITANEN